MTAGHTTDNSPPSHPFGAEAAGVPSIALGVLSESLRDAMDRLRRRTKRDGFSAGVAAAERVLAAFVDAVACEAERRDWRRNQEARG